MARVTFDILGRRADGRGTVDLERNSPSATVAINTARAIFDSDHSWTVVWIMDRGAHQAIEVFSRPIGDPTMADLTTTTTAPSAGVDDATMERVMDFLESTI